jgi:hypothetical protein
MLLARLWVLIPPAIGNIFHFVMRMSIPPSIPVYTKTLTSLIGFLLRFDVHVSLEYTGHGALVHIYGLLFWADGPFLVSIGSSHCLRHLTPNPVIGFVQCAPLAIC